MAQMLEQHPTAVLQNLEHAQNVPLLKNNFGELLEAPETFLGKIVTLLERPVREVKIAKEIC